MSTKVLSQDLTQKEKTMFESLISKVPQYLRQYKGPEGTTTTIRSIRVGDMVQVIKLVCNVEAEEPNSEHISFSAAKADIKSSLQNTNPIVLVAEQDDKVIAFLWGYDVPKNKFPILANYLSKHKHVSYLDNMAVEPQSRRHGIAGELMDSYKEIAKRIGVDHLVLKTMNPAAMKLYKEKKHYVEIVDPLSKETILDRHTGGVPHRFLHLEIKSTNVAK